MKNKIPSPNLPKTGVDSAVTPNPHLRNIRGAALVAVLALIVLMGALVTIFLVRTAVERSASASYDAASSTRLLADTTVNLVQATINEATSGGSRIAWASQPGAIRTFDDSGAPSSIYRLYSGTAATASNVSQLAGDMPPANWASEPALWTDLNKPVTVTELGASGTTYQVYPILDPRDPSNTAELLSGTNSIGLPKLDGFSISGAPGSTTLQPAPMPVRWLYVLRDGQIVSPIAGPNGTVIVASATTNNPITGRIAFWTDDETAKVNVNTAAGSFSSWSGTRIPGTWDTPRFKIWLERMLFSENQPVKGEYQRYPGHPATTDISTILTALGVPLSDYPYEVQVTSGTGSQPDPTLNGSGLYSILPRYADSNSSRAGSRNTTKMSLAGVGPVINSGVPKQERLFPSIGELLFTGSRAASALSRQQTETGKFFLTSQSRAPEVTLFGTPRIPMWPIADNPSDSYRTAYDKLIAFCTTTGIGGSAHPYYVQRSNSRSTTNDYDAIPRNKKLFSYLKNLTSRDIPGFGGNFASKYSYSKNGAIERDQILTSMMDYIRSTNLHDNSVSGSSLIRFTDNPSNISTGVFNFQGQAAPMKISDGSATTRGLGRAYTFSEIGVQVICTAEGSTTPHFNYITSGTTAGYQTPEDIGGKMVSPAKGSANDPKYASNLPVAQFLRDDSGTKGIIIGWNPTTKTVVAGTADAPPDPPAEAFPANQTLVTSGTHGTARQALAPGEKMLQAMLLFDIASPMMGYDPFATSEKPAFRVKVSGIEGIIIFGNNPFPSRTTSDNTKTANLNGNGFVDGIATRQVMFGTGGNVGFRYLLGEQGEHFNAWSGSTPSGAASPRPYRFVSNPFKVTGTTVGTLGGGFQAELHYMTGPDSSEAYQTFDVNFPPTANLPQPDLMLNGLLGPTASNTPFLVNVPADWWGFDFRIARANQPRTGPVQSNAYQGPGTVIRSDAPVSGTWQYNQSRQARIPTFANQNSDAALYNGSDVVRTIVARDGDYRMTAALDPVVINDLSSSPFAKGPGYDTTIKLGHIFKEQGNSFSAPGVDNGGKLVAGANYSWKFTPKVPTTMSNPSLQSTWDWDNGLPNDPDGAYSGKPDEGNIYTNNDSPYYNQQEAGGATKIPAYFTANRIVNSPVMFGSLPTGVLQGVPWRTPLFRPSPAANRPFDPAGPKDHLLLDLFWMPVVEPYAISEPFSTAGKVNVNYQIVPFTYIKRSTGVRAVLNSELIARVPLSAAPPTDTSSTGNGNTYYKGKPASTTPSTPQGSVSVARLPIDLNETLKQFDEKFADTSTPLQPKDIFKSASEICDLYLVPQGYTLGEIQGSTSKGWYGSDFALVGDNSRERPYGNIYSRITTKSNTFTVHYIVQTLKNPPSADPTIWNESKGQVTGELRGSTTLERFLDPADSNIPDYAETPTADSLDTRYQWRVISNSTFAP
jgi:uncharacterized protein (TIGR02600 family)